MTAPESLHIPITPDDILERLADIESIDDLLDWILDSCEEIDFDSAMRLFHAIIERQPDHARPTQERLDYEHQNFFVNATRWTWKGQTDADGTTSPIDGQPARKTRRGFPVTQKR